MLAFTYLDNGVGDLRGWHDGVGRHHTVGVLLTDLGDQESTHTRTGTTTKRVGDLEACRGGLVCERTRPLAPTHVKRMARDITSRSQEET